MNARTGSLPWDLSGRAKTPEEYKAWLEKLAYDQTKLAIEKSKNPMDSSALMPPRTET